MIDFAVARKNMIDGQIHPAGVVDEGILDAFTSVPREVFVTEKLKSVAYTDDNIDLGQGRSLIEPITLGRMVQAVNPTPDDVVLVIGAATGYVSAILSLLVSTVISQESNKRHADKAERVLGKLGYCNVVSENGDVTAGVAKHGPYNIIFINGSVEQVPDIILDQLGLGACLVAVIRCQNSTAGQATLFVKSENGNVSSRPLFDACVPFLKEFQSQPSFKL